MAKTVTKGARRTRVSWCFACIDFSIFPIFRSVRQKPLSSDLLHHYWHVADCRRQLLFSSQGCRIRRQTLRQIKQENVTKRRSCVWPRAVVKLRAEG
jgi:hypothetical protein